MKRKLYGGLLLLALLPLASCSLIDAARSHIDEIAPEPPIITPDDNISSDITIPVPEVAGKYKVIYDFNNGEIREGMVYENNLVPEPSVPKKLHAKFLYWCKDEELSSKFDFNSSVHSDIILYAKYEIDFMALTNEVSASAIHSNIRIIGTYTNGPLSGGQTSLGSGVIIEEKNGFYYALTNNHVVYKPAKYSHAKYEVIDCYQNYYDCIVIAASADYDLGLIKFQKNPKNKPLKVTKMQMDSLSRGEVIISMGEPLGQSNTITYGTVLHTNASFTPAEETLLESNVKFRVINHSAPINSGSSGGALLDTNLNLVGLNFASSTSIDSNEFLYSHAIPLNKIKEFLSKISY